MCITSDSDYQAQLISALKENEYMDASGQISDEKSDTEVLNFLMSEAMPILNGRLEYLYGMYQTRGHVFNKSVIEREIDVVMKIIEGIFQDITISDSERKQFERKLVEGVDGRYKSFLE